MTEQPFETVGETRGGRWLVTCDHATNIVPPCVNGGSLGITPADMARHIAWDPGAAGVARALAERLDAPLVLSRFSRLVIDPNRSEDDPTLVMRLYDGTVIPANRAIDEAETDRRIRTFWRPYHTEVARLAARRSDTVLLAIHSFTPQLKGRPPRPWQIGILHAADDRLARPLIARLRAEGDLCVGENEPYGGHLPGDSVDRHAEAFGRPNVLVELRNDVIAAPADQAAWAARLAPILEAALADTGA
ncbi:N-formylglutamate amidohydrolase [Rhodovulum sulfidophilum]|uniref:N-formylglutamate amidohydrolase n=1 Tax=Rhodovulum sulfidophilum TaxID=35806 RepID=UPI00192468D5|nr:N-formylglutamate amidohydrolase [Rhodovulum sulfidophilum]MBL3575934.1 N-formylglutamate amidohydrolase [Rhodovulum sulfidophilum]MBL3585959.1 N-formylglutamate amidohydrolase [Rhodovulum sulfidophilum]MCE8432890.1 N-formylglutamate amidohydrolase [Rhodovulum sulfidophilum]MCF4117669.1 N-formylglutamate amidohydrolase [Rhodovulum sulfidophilum]